MRERSPNPFKLAFLALLGTGAYMCLFDGADVLVVGSLLLVAGIPFVSFGGAFAGFVIKRATPVPPRVPARVVDTEIIEISVPAAPKIAPRERGPIANMTYGQP